MGTWTGASGASIGLSPAEVEAARALVSGGGDLRRLANWFGGGPFDGRSVLFVGDSTSEQLAGINRVAYAGGFLSAMQLIAPDLIGRNVSLKNRGLNGGTLANFISPGTGSNAGGMPSKLDDVCAELATLTRPLVVLCYGLNEARQDATIAGQAYGSAAHQTAANGLRANLRIACDRMVAANPLVSIILRMPNGLAATAPGLLVNSVTGQNAMDLLRLAYRGDTALSFPPLDEFISGPVALFDTMRAVFGDTAYTNALINADGLHPSTAGYDRTLAALMRMVAGPEAAALATADSYAQARRFERAAGHGPVRPRAPDDIKRSGEWELVSPISVVAAETTYFDLGGLDTAGIAALWGAAAAAGYGTAAQPQMGFADYMVFEPPGLAPLIIPVTRLPDTNAGGYLRWFGGGPDGVYPSSAALPAGTVGGLWRHRWNGADNARRNSAARAAGGVRAAVAYRNTYRAFITSATNGSVTLRGIGGLPTSLAAKTLTTSDTICILGVDDSSAGGVPLTGATFTQPDPTTGVAVINLAGRDFTRWAFRQAVILSNT